MVEMSVGYKYGVELRKILNAQPRSAKSLENEKPGGKDGVYNNIRAANLQEERRMSNESDPELALGGEHWPIGPTGALGHR